MDCLVIRAVAARSVSRLPPGSIPRSTWQWVGLMSEKPASGSRSCSTSAKAAWSRMISGAICGLAKVVRITDKFSL